MCNIIGLVVDTSEPEQLATQLDAWARQPGREVYLDRHQFREAGLFLEGVPVSSGTVSVYVGHSESGCSCGLFETYHGGEEYLLTATAREELSALLDLCGAAARWMRFGLSARFYGMTVAQSDMARVKAFIHTGELPYDTLFHMSEGT